MKRELTKLTVLFIFIGLTGCPQTEFVDDFEDGNLHPAYQFPIGDPSMVDEHDGILETCSNVMLMLATIPGDPFPFAPTEIKPGVDLSLDVLVFSPNEVVLLNLSDNGKDPQDFFSVGYFASIPYCADEDGILLVEGVPPSLPMTISIACEEDGTVTGTFSDESGTYECPLVSLISDSTLDAAFSMGGRLGPGHATVDNFSVSMRE